MSKWNVKNLFGGRFKKNEKVSAEEQETRQQPECPCCAAEQYCDSVKPPVQQPAAGKKRRVAEPGWEEDELYE